MKMTARLGILIVVTLFMLGCNSGNQSSETSEKPKPFEPTYYTGREAITKMYIAARSWSADAKPFRLQSQPTKDHPGQDGKAGLWRAGFASPSRRTIRTFVWSGVKSNDAPEPGISFSTEDTYSPSNTSTQIFDIAFLKVDSDAAWDAAQKHGGEKLTKTSPDMPAFYVVDWNGRENKLIWHVKYADSSAPKLNVAVDASIGDFLRVEK